MLPFKRKATSGLCCVDLYNAQIVEAHCKYRCTLVSLDTLASVWPDILVAQLSHKWLASLHVV